MVEEGSQHTPRDVYWSHTGEPCPTVRSHASMNEVPQQAAGAVIGKEAGKRSGCRTPVTDYCRINDVRNRSIV